MSLSRFSRRSLLRGLGATGALLPLLNARPALGQTTTFPKRFITIAWPNGVLPEFWPTGAGSNFTIADSPLSPLAPLIPHQDDLIVVGGLELKTLRDTGTGGGGGHASFPYMLTGDRGQPVNVAVNQDGYRYSAGGISLDQLIADEIAKKQQLRFHSLQVNALATGGAGRYISFRGAPVGGLPNAPTPDEDPLRLFDKLFSGGVIQSPELLRLRNERKSVLDVVRGSLERIRQQVGTDDRQKLDAHLSAVRGIEQQLEALGGGCAIPPKPLPPTNGSYTAQQDNFLVPEILKLDMDLVVAAMACDQTRVATMVWSSPHNNQYVFKWLGDEFIQSLPGDESAGYDGAYRHHHEIAHNAAKGGIRAEHKNRVDRWFFEQLAYLVAKLKSVPEGAGTLFDNTVILFANNMRLGHSHETHDLPWVLMGSCGGYFQTGQVLRYASGTAGDWAAHNRLLVSIANAMDVPITSFGDPAYGGALSALKR